MRRFLPWGACLALAAYYCYFAQVTLRAGFTHDDLMNMHAAVSAPWHSLVKECVFFFLPSDQYRPVGAVYYRAVRDLFGVHPMPFHVTLAVLWLLAMAVVYDAGRQLFKSAEVALVAVLLSIHHSNRPFYYYNSGFCYDILCLLFSAGALTYYLRSREHGRLREKHLLILSALYILALGSKEMAVVMPVLFLAWEFWQPAPRDWRFTMLSGVMTVLFLAGRVFGPNGISGVGSYVPRPSIAAYLESWNDWLTHITFLAPTPLATGWIVLFLVLLVAGAWISGERSLRLATVLLLIGVLPVAFIRPARGLEQVVLPFTGLAWILAWWITRLTLIIPGLARAPLVFTLLLVILLDWHGRRMPTEEAMLQEGRGIGHIWAALRQATPGLKPDAKVLIRKDSFTEPFTWATVFMARIDSGMELHIIREESQPTPQDPATFDWVLAWDKDHFNVLKSPR